MAVAKLGNCKKQNILQKFSPLQLLGRVILYNVLMLHKHTNMKFAQNVIAKNYPKASSRLFSSMINAEKTAISVFQYKPEHKNLWDKFVSNSKNGNFLFYRDYMEYHSNKFTDNSLLFFKNGQPLALLPANIHGAILHSHEGLTFGGVISGFNMTTVLMMEIFENLVDYCREHGIRKILYKAIPHIYHLIPAEEDLYALFRHGAKFKYRTVSSSVYLPIKTKYSYNRKRMIKKAKDNGIVVKRNFDFNCFMNIVENVLMEYHWAKPVHTAEEIKLLAERFPNNIKLFSSFKNEIMLGGVIVYESANVAHSQYGANSNEGRRVGAEDFIFDYLINDYYKDKKYFDFGTSTEKFGQILNTGLIHYKEGFGSTAVAYDCYQLTM
jgi:hypothetical protein